MANTTNTEGLFRRPRSKYWWMRYYAFDPAKGKRVKVQKSTGVTSLRKAKVIRATAMAAVASGKHTPQHVERLKFEDLGQGLIAHYRANGKRSIGQATRAFDKHLARTFGGSRAVDITASRILAYLISRLDEGAARATVYYELAMLKYAFKLAIRRGELTTMPVFPEMGNLNNARTGFFSEGDLAALLVELPEYVRGPAEFAYCTGWRRMEILTLRWDQVDWPAQEVRLEVGSTKNYGGRVFPFGDYPQLRGILERQQESHDKWGPPRQTSAVGVSSRRRMHTGLLSCMVLGLQTSWGCWEKIPRLPPYCCSEPAPCRRGRTHGHAADGPQDSGCLSAL